MSNPDRPGTAPGPGAASGDLFFRIGVVLAAGALFLWFWASGMVHPASPRFERPARPPEGSSAPLYRERFASNGETAEVHASTAFGHAPDGVTALWYGGTREGASDVAIYQSRLQGGQWDKPHVVVDREQMKADLSRHIRKVGNSTVHRHPDGRLWLFFVTVSVGGWAGSSISLVESLDNGQTWSRARRLVTAPFFNLSTLVRGSAFQYADGTVGLPVYQEFLGKFGELLRLDRNGRILQKTRLTSGREALQPEIAIVDGDKAVGLLRYAGAPPRRVLHTVTEDAGRHWSRPEKLQLPNPDSALDVLELDGERMLAVLNDIDEARYRLILAVSDDLGREWRTVKVLEEHPDENNKFRHEFSYPWLLRTDSGAFHLLYTWNRTRIKHIEFNQSWLDAATSAAADGRSHPRGDRSGGTGSTSAAAVSPLPSAGRSTPAARPTPAARSTPATTEQAR